MTRMEFLYSAGSTTPRNASHARQATLLISFCPIMLLLLPLSFVLVKTLQERALHQLVPFRLNLCEQFHLQLTETVHLSNPLLDRQRRHCHNKVSQNFLRNDLHVRASFVKEV